MGNVEYAAGYSEVVLPLVCTLRPDLIVVAYCFDAAQGRFARRFRLKHRHVLYHDNESLESVQLQYTVALEGGYTLDVCAACMEAVALALLHNPLNAHQPKHCDSLDSTSSEEEELVDGDQLVWSSWSSLPRKRK
jgi:acetoin utilization deacetylase AcuC-like enzyme